MSKIWATTARLAKTPGKWLGAGVDLLLPRFCVFCDCDLAEGSHDVLLCEQCRRGLEADVQGHCPRCAAVAAPRDLQVATETAEAAPRGNAQGCQACSGRRWSFEQVIALGKYRAALRSAVLRLKAPRQEPLAAAVAGLLWLWRGERLQNLRFDAVVPVPIHWTRRLFRGANSPETVAEVLAGKLQAAFETGLVRCRRRTQPQRTLSRADRYSNVRGAFCVASDVRLEGARVLLVDDTLTTGATCNEIGRTLRRAGAASVSVAALARADEWV